MSNKKIYNSLSDLINEEFKPKWYDYPSRFLFRILSKVKRTGNYLCDLVMYGFDSYEAWDFISWHANIVVPRLKLLKEIRNSYPSDLTEEEWVEVLDKIIWTFENIDNYPDLEYSEDFDCRIEHTYDEETGITYTRYLNETGTIDRSAYDEHQRKIDEGLELFAKYYQGLWD